jgi:hypothetical protein
MTHSLEGWDIGHQAERCWTPWGGSTGNARAKVLAIADDYYVTLVEADEAAAHARPTLVPHSSHTRPTDRGTQRGSTVTHGQDEVSNRPPFPQVTAHSRTSADVPSTGLEPVAYRLGGGRSIHLSYEGALRR